MIHARPPANFTVRQNHLGDTLKFGFWVPLSELFIQWAGGGASASLSSSWVDNGEGLVGPAP